MSLDPNRALSPGAVAAIRDLIEAPEAPGIDDASLLQVALGVADEAARRLCVEAVVASDEVRARLARVRRMVRHQLGDGLEGADRTLLRRLRVFAAPFSARDAAAVFPASFQDQDALSRLVLRGWLAETDGVYELVGHIKGESPDDSGIELDEGWAERFVSLYAARAAWIDRTASEGRWTAAAEILRRDLPDLRAAWNRAGALGQNETVEAFARALVVPLAEAGARIDLADLVAAGHRAARALGSTRLRMWLLSLEGVTAARAGERQRARDLWGRRLRLARDAKNRAVEADTLIDLANLSGGDDDHETRARLLEEAAAPVAASGRADLAANLWAAQASESLRGGDLQGAASLAERALAELAGTEGASVGLYVRIQAARTLRRCGRLRDAADVLVGILEACVEGGRAASGANVLTELAEVLEGHGRVDLANQCLGAALGIHRQLGSRHATDAAGRLRAFRERCPSLPADEAAPDVLLSWERAAMRIVAEIVACRAEMANR